MAGKDQNKDHNVGHVVQVIGPVLDIEFPATDVGQKPVTRKYVLKDRC